ncbi:hypothetical protein SAMN05444339_101148 [Loktanella atrilutea]|uniref:VPLPA-CTERM protein sorting domain-containing protein n=1 Tax=Loktanella atrilutea TaxID=366533 RepID=A0A1M4SUS9_LOKAT|nr:hypothetical protein [Loktanella atrilutea]SHE35971.1 hypothetical protein SAMN05444339_101148 [Loktanella atrilutea]
MKDSLARKEVVGSLSLSLAFFLTAPLHAATLAPQLSAFAMTGGCTDVDLQGDTSANASCLTASPTVSAAANGRASFGNIGASTSVVAAPNGLGQNGDFAISSGSFSDTLNFSVLDGFWRVPVDFLGNLSIGVNSPETGVEARVAGSFSVNGVSIFESQTTALYDNVTGALFYQTVETGNAGITSLLLPFTNGTLNVGAEVTTRSSCGKVTGPEELCFTQSNFFSSARFLSSEVLDFKGEIVRNAEILSASGFDYIKGVRPHEVSAVPLPASAWGFVIALIFLSAVKLRPMRNTS